MKSVTRKTSKCFSLRCFASRYCALIIFLLFMVSIYEIKANTSPLPETIQLANVFSNNMVLQRNKPVRFWGTSKPNHSFTLSFANTQTVVKADNKGNWSSLLNPLSTGGPHTLTLEGNVHLSNVLIGDVWLCSGQSNMAWSVKKSTGEKPWATNEPQQIRLLTVKRDYSPSPLQNFHAKSQWEEATKNTLENFSAVCAHFAENIQENGVPLGLINASWGGSVIEAWMSEEALANIPVFHEDLQLLKLYTQKPKQAEALYAKQWQQWWLSHSDQPYWQTSYSKHWRTVPSMVTWKEYDDPKLNKHDGHVWYAKEFHLTQIQAEQSAQLHLGGIDEVDVTWVNGNFVGTQFGWGTPRHYSIPSSVLKVGKNQLVVNVLSTYGGAGMIGPQKSMQLTFANGSTLPLGENWKYHPVPKTYGYPKSAPWESINGLSGLFNAMLAPLKKLNIAGAVWYQGESNTGRAEAYQQLLKSMITDWRKTYGETLPFVVIQLPNFGKDSSTSSKSGWANLRNAQWNAIKNDSNSGLVITIDLGDNNDIHPTDKSIVGARAAKVAFALLGKNNAFKHGIHPENITRKDGKVLLTFAPEVKLQLKGAATLQYFELCNSDTCKRVKANLKTLNTQTLNIQTTGLKKNIIEIASKQFPTAERVRYCWADGPSCHLFSGSGLPVSSFEMNIDNNAGD